MAWGLADVGALGFLEPTLGALILGSCSLRAQAASKPRDSCSNNRACV